MDNGGSAHSGSSRNNSGGLLRSVSASELAQYLALTVALGGLQFVWSVETGFGSLYLLSLGMKKSLVSLVWLAGPLSGLITQPLVGILSDNCTAKLGRRRPYIIGSTAVVVLCLAVIGWTRELTGGRSVPTIWLAVIAFYVLDFAINCIQASLRALIVDSLPTSRQDAGTAWASRMIGAGNVAGYLMGFLDLVRLLPLLGSTHMQVLTSIASLALVATVATTCYFTTETPLARLPTLSNGTNDSSGSLRALGSIFTSIRSLPAAIKGVCRIQLFSWIGWFPFLFYGTTYIAHLYVAAHAGQGGHGSSTEHADLMEKGTRAGSLAMFAYALSSLSFSVILPLFAYSSASRSVLRQRESRSHTMSTLSRIRLVLRKARRAMSVSLSKMWMVSLCVFSVAMLLTFVVTSVRGATWLIAACGFSWAVTIWVPFSIIGETISDYNSAEQPLHAEGRGDGYVPIDSTDIPMEELSAGERVGDSGQLEDPASDDAEDARRRRLSSAGGLSAGTILGIHNVFIVVPQFITALASSLIFAFFERANGSAEPERSDSQHAHEIALVLCLGGLSSAIAAYYAWKLGC
ncbi:hypothetical protein IWW47_001360 [Coemansia sp. RSA 2052]|nr:hypothetical protein IWW47_001360 [Coemansia sp. RSA 2052]